MGYRAIKSALWSEEGRVRWFFGGAAALVRFLEQMRGGCFIIESRSDSLCLCFSVFVSVWEGGTQISVIFLGCGFG